MRLNDNLKFECSFACSSCSKFLQRTLPLAVVETIGKFTFCERCETIFLVTLNGATVFTESQVKSVGAEIYRDENGRIMFVALGWEFNIDALGNSLKKRNVR